MTGNPILEIEKNLSIRRDQVLDLTLKVLDDEIVPTEDIMKFKTKIDDLLLKRSGCKEHMVGQL